MQVKEGQKIEYMHEGKDSLVHLDSKLLQNIMINLLSNAVKYSPPHSLVEFVTRLEENNLYVLVKDQGMGVPADEIPHLFDRFFRAKNATNIQGTGLGLSIVKAHVELMQGTIEVKSVLNEGTEFSLRFPKRLPKS